MSDVTVKNVRFLKLSFVDEADKIVSIQFPNPREDLKLEHIEPVMDMIITKNFFLNNGVYLVKKSSAEVIERVVTTQDFEITVS